ncbi:MAG: tetratricopeptide repeat protein [Acidiferrobacterales bacterium]
MCRLQRRTASTIAEGEVKGEESGRTLLFSGLLLGTLYFFTPCISQATVTYHHQVADKALPSLHETGLLAYRYSEADKAIERGNYEQAIHILQLLAKQGAMKSQYDLGVMYYHGLGVKQDKAEAMRWNRMAAEQGHIAAQYNMGIAYSTGTGVDLDAVKAADWWRKAALQGSTEAQFNLGLMYAQGDGVTQNMMQAARWWYEAATHGDAAAQYALGLMFARGDGVTQNLNEAAKWWYLAASQGFERAKNALNKLRLIVIPK